MKKTKKNYKNLNKSILRRNIITLSTSFVLMIVALVATILVLNKSTDDKKFMAYNGYYASEQDTISSSAPIDSYIKLGDLYTISSGNISVTSSITPSPTQYLTIESQEDLYAFDQLCNDNSTFNTYKYKLLKDISWNYSYPFEPINSFAGEFDGSGYTIKNLALTEIGSGESALSENYGMFREIASGASVHHLGLIDMNINISTAPESGKAIYVANVCAVNKGTINYVYVRDGYELTEKEDLGINVLTNGYYISGMVGQNQGTFTNSYYVGKKVFTANTLIPDEFQEMLLDNSGTISNLFFYDAQIDTYGTNGTTITYSELNKTYNYTTHYGTYCATLDELNTNVTAVSSTEWIKADYYDGIGNFGALFDFTTPAIAKIAASNVSYDSENVKYTVTISSNDVYNFIYNQMNINEKFTDASMIYELACNINLNDIAVPSYDDSIQSTFRSATGSTHTIYLSKYNYKVSTGSYEAYGVFPYFSGSISNINFVIGGSAAATISSTTSNIKAVGGVVGYAEGATISNVNVYMNLSFDNAINKYFVGGIAGVIGAETTITNSTSTGTIANTNNTHSSFSEVTDIVNGVAIGGCVGYVEKSGASVNTLLSEVNITTQGYTSKDVIIGGVVGAGYLIYSNYLQNNGTISIGTSSSVAAYSNIYASGVIGRLLGMYEEATYFTNNGDITLYQASSSNTYLSGILNADIQTSSTGTYVLKSKGKFQFWAAGLTNGANISLKNASSGTVLYTYGVNVFNANNFVTKLSGLYNVNYRFASESTALGAMTINMNYVQSFAPLLVSNNTSNENYSISLTTAYNLRDFTYTISNAITTSTDFTYTGAVLADYVDYTDVRNEGSQTMTLNSAITGDIKITGLFNELSGGFSATSIYNGGSISITYTAIITGNIYASGICYANRNGFSSSEILKYNPSSATYDKSLVGSINNCINNGAITVTSTYFADSYITYSTANTILSYNQQSYLGNTVDITTTNLVYVDGDIFTSGITSINESVITNTFNIGDITAANYIINKTKTEEVNAAGISVLNIGQYAYILNSANDGNIKAMNVSSSSAANTIDYLSEVNAAGISCRNDELEDGTSYSGNSSNPNSKQVISFTINYGSVYSYNYRYNITSTAMEPTAKSAGILAMGLCSVINVTNYANIYGSETASGIFGIVYFTKFTSEVSSNIYIANTLNYGNVYILERGYNHVHGSTYDDYNYVKYNTFISFTNDTASDYSLTSVVRNTDYRSIIGSIFAIVNFGNASNYNYIVIRYLISFDEAIEIAGAITGYALDANPDVSSFYSAHISTNAKTGAYATDTYMGKYVQYAPLITGDFSGTFVTNIDTDGNVTTASKTYTGVFSTNFAFMQAIKGNETYIDTTTYVTDIFISDYFEFVGAVYVNPLLLETIGWGDITYTAAAEAFATSLDGVATFIKYMSGLSNTAQYESLISAALSTDTWISKCDTSILLDVTETLIKNEDSATLLQMVDYIFSSGSSSYSLITTATRTAILEAIIAADTNISYSGLLDTIITYANGYSSLLADSILSNDAAGQYLHDYIYNLDQTTVESILTTYCNYLKDAETNAYFTYKNSEQVRYDLLNAMFENITDETFYEKLAELIEIDDEISSAAMSDVIKMYSGYSTLTNAEKISLYQNIIVNNTSSTSVNWLYTYITSMASEIGYFNRLIENGYSKTSLDNINSDISYDETSTSEAVIDERIALWNQIKNTTIFKSYINNYGIPTIYAKATEYNNTYQSITEPHNYGAFVGDTTENRLSYLYTTDITPEVYFYGPYTDTSGSFYINSANGPASKAITGADNQIIDNSNNITVYTFDDTISNDNASGYQSIFHYADTSIWSSTDIVLGRGGSNSTVTYADGLLPGDTGFTYATDNGILMYYDLNNEQFGEASSAVTDFKYTDGTTIANFLGFDNNLTKESASAVDPMTGNTCRTSDWSGVKFGRTTDTMTVITTGETFSLNNATITGIYWKNATAVTLADGTVITPATQRIYLQDENGTYHPIYGNVRFNSTTNSALNGKMIAIGTNEAGLRKSYSYLAYLYGLKYYTSEVTSSWHSTGRTGIYRFAQPWGNHTQYFTWKQKQSRRVFTSQYIDYSIDDLLNLDGYLTEYNDGTTKSSDERDIINYLFNTYFVGDTNFAKFVAAALLERNMYDEDYNVDIDYIDEFFTTNIYSTSTISSKVPLAYLYQTYSSKTVKAYLMALATSSEDYKAKFIAYCTSNQSAYAKLLLQLMTLDETTFSLSDIIAEGEGSSTDTGAITIDNVASYENLYFVQQDVTINEEDLTYGMKFDEITFNLNTAWKKIYLYSMPTGTSATLNVKLDSDTTGTDYTITTTNNNRLEITLDNNSTMTLTSNNDLILYKVIVDYSEEVVTTPTETYNYSYNISTNTYTLDSEGAIEEYVMDYLDGQSITYSDLVINSYTYTLTGYNNSTNSRTLYLYYNGSSIQQSGSISAGGTYVFNSLSSEYSGATVYLYNRRNGGTNLSNNAVFNNITISINYTYTKTTTITYNVTLADSDSNYAEIISNLTNAEYCNKVLDESTNYSTKYNTLVRSALQSLTPIDYSSTLTNPTYEGTASKNIIEILQLSATHDDTVTPEYCVPDFLALFITSSNSAFKSFVDSAVASSSNATDDYEIILNYLVTNLGYYSLGDAIESIGSSLTTASKERIAAAYLASNYKYILNNSLSVDTSYLNSYINNTVDNDCKYISGNTYISDYFVNFCSLIGYNLSTAGYGIYALASNQGKLNGQFIPDNLELDTMDPYYESASNVGYKLIEASATATTSANWRGGTSTNEDDKSNTASVNYAFYNEMRQLIKSISTTVFDLTIQDTSSDEIYYADIDLDNATITYYIEDLSSTTTFEVLNIDLAYKAVALVGTQTSYSDEIREFKKGNTFTASELNTVQYTFTVFAEDTTVHTIYSIIFKQITTTLTMTYSDNSTSKTVESSTTDTNVVLNITSTNNKLREGLNLEPYLTFVLMDGNNETDTVYTMSSDYITISALSTDHRIKADGTAVATMIVSYKLPAGTYHIKLSICGISVYVTYIKEASSACTISATFDGGTTNIFASSTTANSDIQFGRLYNNIELTDFEGKYYKYGYEFYLDSFEYSANATVEATVTRTTSDVILDANVLYTKYVYTVKYVITAEDGVTTATYTHVLTEKDPYDAGDKFADVTKDGSILNIYSSGSTLYNNDDTITEDNVITVKYYDDAESIAKVQFNRSDSSGNLEEPKYRITYVMTNIYTTSPTKSYTASETTEDENIINTATLKTMYNGLNIKLSYLCETGFYKFRYTYHNTGLWDIVLDENGNVTSSEEYTQTYNFPEIQINKLFSLDATLHYVTFLDSYQALSAASTGMTVEPMRPSDEHLVTADNEWYFADILDDAENWETSFLSNPISYQLEGQTDYSTTDYDDYYIVGSVSNAQLKNYAPIFEIEEHAMIFQYVTSTIQTSYGLGKQTGTDKSVLEDHTGTTYLYAPFVDASDNQATFLIKLGSDGKTLQDIYVAEDFTDTGSDMNRTIYIAKTQSTAFSFTYGGTTYTLNQEAFGSPTDNNSLYMDYIGNPLDDHFWYVSYVIFSENYIKSTDNTYVKYYHIALIDTSNNVYFEVDVIVPADFNITKYSTLYFAINGTYIANKSTGAFGELIVGAYVINPTDYTLSGTAKKQYTLRYAIQMLPSAYYYFDIDLPVGYQAEATVTNKANQNGIGDYLGGNATELVYEGAYLPPSSLVPQVVKVTINVTEGEASETNVWGIQSSDVYTRRATLDDDRTVGN